MKGFKRACVSLLWLGALHFEVLPLFVTWMWRVWPMACEID
jgi:hypothetical protein